MSYTARHFVMICGCMYTPGEIIDKEIPEEKLERLLRIGAIASITFDVPGRDMNKKDNDGCQQPKDDVPDEADDVDGEEAVAIDVMDGIVAADGDEEKEGAVTEPHKKTTGKGRKKA